MFLKRRWRCFFDKLVSIFWWLSYNMYLFFFLFQKDLISRGAVLDVSATISGHRRRGLADGEQRIALRPIRTKPKSTACCVPRAPQRVVSPNDTEALATWEIYGSISRSRTLPAASPCAAGVIWWFSSCTQNKILGAGVRPAVTSFGWNVEVKKWRAVGWWLFMAEGFWLLTISEKKEII